MKNLKKIIKHKVLSLGFDVVGFSKPQIDSNTKKNYLNFLKKNFHGDMQWLEYHYDKKVNPLKYWENVKTVMMQGINYSPESNPLDSNDHLSIPNISVYAKNKDYHDLIRKKLFNFKYWLKKNHNLESKVFVDTSPVLEKYFSELSGIGWQGKHTNLVSKKFGSWLFLSGVFLPIELSPDNPIEKSCGTCKDCINICPTNAIISENQIDARKCISYLTIEHRGPFPFSLRKSIGNKIYGCDDCLAVCPWNKFTKPTKVKDFIQLKKNQDLNFFLSFNEKFFLKYFDNSPIKRIGYVSFLRNVIIAAGNSSSTQVIPNIFKHLSNRNPIVRGSCIWTLSQLLDKEKLKKTKKDLLLKEKNKYVLYELNRI